MPAVSERRQPSGTAFALRDPLPWDDLAAIVRASEDAGYVTGQTISVDGGRWMLG